MTFKLYMNGEPCGKIENPALCHVALIDAGNALFKTKQEPPEIGECWYEPEGGSRRELVLRVEWYYPQDNNYGVQSKSEPVT